METNYGAHLEIHFHQQCEVSIFLENTAPVDHEIYSDLFLLSLFVTRNLGNLEQDNAVGQSLSYVLENIEKQSDQIFDPEKYDEISLVPYKGVDGRKRFVADMMISEERLRFKLKPKGFGFWGRGLGFYSPSAVMMLIKFMGNKYRNDVNAIKAINATCKRLGHAAREISPSSQYRIVMEVTSIAIGIYDGTLEDKEEEAASS
jgi:hypothetical protein